MAEDIEGQNWKFIWVFELNLKKILFVFSFHSVCLYVTKATILDRGLEKRGYIYLGEDLPPPNGRCIWLEEPIRKPISPLRPSVWRRGDSNQGSRLSLVTTCGQRLRLEQPNPKTSFIHFELRPCLEMSRSRIQYCLALFARFETIFWRSTGDSGVLSPPPPRPLLCPDWISNAYKCTY